MAYCNQNPDLFRFSPTAPDSGEENSDLDNQDHDDYASSDEPVEATDGRMYQWQAIRGNQLQQCTEIKEQMYQDKLSHLKRQLDQLHDESLPEYSKKLKRVEATYRERMRITTVIRDLEVDMVEQDFINEKRSAAREFEEQKVFLRDQLISELEDKQRMIEAERHNMELTGDSTELKPISTRKLRRRANEGGSSYNDKRSGAGMGGRGKQPCNVSNLNYVLQEQEINEDLKIINKNKTYTSMHHKGNLNNTRAGNSNGGHTISSSERYGGSTTLDHKLPKECRIDEGKLFYEKRWYRRGQSIQLESSKGEKFPAMISAIGSESVWVRKLNDNSKIRIYLTQLSKGKYTLKRRAV